MPDLRVILAAALGLSLPASAQQPTEPIPEASEAPVPAQPTTAPAPTVPANCTTVLDAARCDAGQLLQPDVAIALAHAVWAFTGDPAATRASLAVPSKEAERATGHLMYRVTRNEGGRQFNAVVDAETGAVIEEFITFIRRGRPLMGAHGPIRAERTGPAVLGPLAQAWADAALDEAASVVAFEVHAEELRAIGAPSSFVARAMEAADDERRHAHEAFVLASRFAGRAIEAGPMPQAAAPRQRRFDVVRGVLREGCLNETLALAEAREALVRCVDPQVRTALEAVVREEMQHAALAFETLRWALPRLSAVERQRLRQDVLDYRAAIHGPSVPDGFGILPGAVAGLVQQQALSDIVRPLLLTALA